MYFFIPKNILDTLSQKKVEEIEKRKQIFDFLEKVEYTREVIYLLLKT